MLGKYLSSQQLEALDVRRTLIVKHFDALIASKGEKAVLYDLPARPQPSASGRRGGLTCVGADGGT
jgi:hypothetical protein